jgi:hypothetical protein
MLKYVLAVGLIDVLGVSSGSQEAGCPAEPQRRQAAVRFAREVNTAQASFQYQNKRYGQISDLAVGAAPERVPSAADNGRAHVQSVHQGHCR